MKKKRTSALPAKLSRPRLTSRVVLRKRLFNILDKGLERKAVWVSGPPGTGKTTLVNSFVESKKIKTLWYQVDGADSDPATFFHYLGGWTEAALRKGAPMLKFSPAVASNLAIFSSLYFQELFSRVKPPFAIVLDNFQEASGEPKFLEIVCSAMKAVPEGCSFILISRIDPPAPFARGCVNNEMAVISWNDMRLTEGETLDVARLTGYGSLSAAIIRDLHLKAEGWMAGLLLLLEQAKKGSQSIKEIFGGATDSSFNYFMAEVFDKLDAETREFLLKSALFQDMTPEMASELSEEKEAARILSSLNAGNFFVAKRAHPMVSYQYHPLFRDFLFARAKEAFDTGYLKALMSRAARISEKAGQIDEAAWLLMEAGDWPGLRQFIYSHADSLISQGRLKLIEEMLRAIPEDFLGQSPWLLYYYGVCLLPLSPARASLRFSAAYERFEREADPRGLFLSWTGAVDTILYEMKDFKPLDRWIGEFEVLRKKFKKFPSEAIEIRVISCIFSALMFRQPWHPELPKWEDRINKIVINSKDDALKLSITRNLILYYLWTGNITKAGVLVGLLKPAAEKMVNDPLAQLMWLRSAALYNLYISSPQIALECVDEGLGLAEKTGIHLIDTMFAGVGIYSCTFTDDAARAEDFLGIIKKGLNSERSQDLVIYHHMTSIVEWMKGRLRESVEHARLTADLSTESGVRINSGVRQFALITVLIEAGRFDGVEELIAQLKETAALTRSHFYHYLGFYAEALLDLKKGNHRSCLDSFGKALKIMKEHGIKVLIVLVSPPTVASLCAKALEEGLETEFVRELIQLNNLKRYPPHKGVEDWPWEIKIYSFGRFEIYRDGKKIEFSRKAQQKPFDLLKAIISLGGNGVPEGELTDMLWPDADGDAGYRSFATTLHRLRRLIGSDRAIRYIDGQVTLEAGYVWVDVWQMEDFLTRADKAEKAGDADRAVQLIEKAMNAYRGPFLSGDSMPCIISFRERLRVKFVRYIGKFGEYLENRGFFDKAVDLYYKGLEVDELDEKFYQNLMRYYSRKGNRAEALKVYKRCSAALSSSLGIAPSSETEAIHKSIITK